MCWVMPAGLAGGDLGLADRVQQRGLAVVDVAHDRDHRRAGRRGSSSASSNSGASGSSSAAVTISILRSYSSAIAFTESSVRVWVRVAISPIIISFLITSALPRPSSSATSRTVAPEWTLVASGSAGVAGFGRRLLEQRPAAATAAAARRALRRRAAHLVAAGGLRVDHDAAFFRARRRRRRRCGRGRADRLGRGGGLSAAGVWRRGFARLSAARLCGFGVGAFGGGFRRRRAAVALGGGDRLQRVGLLDARGGGFRLDPGRLQRRKQLLAAERPALWRSRERASLPLSLLRLLGDRLGLGSVLATSAASSAIARQRSPLATSSASAASCSMSASTPPRPRPRRRPPRPPRPRPPRSLLGRLDELGFGPLDDLARPGPRRRRGRRGSRPRPRRAAARTAIWLVSKRLSAWCCGRPQ